MITLAAPFQGPITITLLDNPAFADTIANVATTNYGEALDGTQYAYKKTNQEYRLIFEFVKIPRGKILEIQEFVKAFSTVDWLLKTHRDEIWKVKLQNDPVTFRMDEKSTPAGGIIKESGSFTLEFVGTKVS